jgi:tRNA(Ile)-lysidine synthase
MNKFEKEEVWIMEAQKKIAWIVGKRIDGRFAVTAQTKKILLVNFHS